MTIEDILAAAAKDTATSPHSAVNGREDLVQQLRLPPIRTASPGPSSSSLPPELQRFALSPEEAAAHQRHSSSNSTLDERDLYGDGPGSKLSTLAALSTMSGWTPSLQDRQRPLPSMPPDPAPLPPTYYVPPPHLSHYPPQMQAWPQPYPEPIRDANGWRVNAGYDSMSPHSLPSLPTGYPAYPLAGPSSTPSSAPPKTYDMAESIRESVEQLQRKQQSMMTQTPEEVEAFNRFAPRSQRACVNCQKAKKRCMPSLTGLRPCERCVRLRLQITCSDAPRKSDFEPMHPGLQQQQQQLQQQQAAAASASQMGAGQMYQSWQPL